MTAKCRRFIENIHQAGFGHGHLDRRVAQCVLKCVEVWHGHTGLCSKMLTTRTLSTSRKFDDCIVGVLGA